MNILSYYKSVLMVRFTLQIQTQSILSKPYHYTLLKIRNKKLPRRGRF